MMQGIRLNMSLWDGKFSSEFLLPMEQDRTFINGDLSPTYIGTVKPVRGVELGAGVSCYHCISVKPSHTSPKLKPSSNSQFQTSYGYGNGYIIDNPNYDPDEALQTFANRYIGGDVNANTRYIIDTTQFYTFRGVKLMARASFDPKAYVSLPM